MVCVHSQQRASKITERSMTRKVTILDSGQFPVLRIENFLSDDEYDIVKKDVKNEVLKLENMVKGGIENEVPATNGKNYNRIYLDSIYGKDRTKSKTLMIITKNLFNPEMFDIYNDIPETAFKLLRDTTTHETEITVYKDKSVYGWHTDVVGRRVVNYVLMIDLGMKFDGGHTQLSNTQYDSLSERTLFEGGLDIDAELDIEPKGNQLIIMPMWVMHRVTAIKMKSDNMLDGRITVNGHVGFIPDKKDVWDIEGFHGYEFD